MTDQENDKGNQAFTLDQSCNPDQLSPLVLAYVGDAVYELYIRQKLIRKVQKMHELHRHAVNWVSAASQAKLLRCLEPHLDEDELTIIRRGRNAKSKVPLNVSVTEYRYSTAFEALIGYLYLSGQKDRLNELLELAGPIV